ncbi:MAG TPA: hypothetical protein VHA52_08245, partial [Candidatus Babeliaceae bacterium]|nr:hypothetical protein [Candidatus Babeliaceae bacterium]
MKIIIISKVLLFAAFVTSFFSIESMDQERWEKLLSIHPTATSTTFNPESTKQNLLKQWGFKNDDTLWLIDNIKNPFQSSIIQDRIQAYERVNIPIDSPDKGFYLLDYISTQGFCGYKDAISSPTEADMLLLVPQLIERGYNPNITIGLNIRYRGLMAPLIF